MNPWVWFPLAGLFVYLVFTLASATVSWVSNRHWAKLQRENDRRKLRYETWASVSRLGGGE